MTWAASWVGGCEEAPSNDCSPYTNLTRATTYTVGWAKGARDAHGLSVKFLGIWNERASVLVYCLCDRLRMAHLTCSPGRR